jgi:hypothetical protein
MGCIIRTVASGEPAWAGAVLKVHDAAWADSVVSDYPELRFFYGEAPNFWSFS